MGYESSTEGRMAIIQAADATNSLVTKDFDQCTGDSATTWSRRSGTLKSLQSLHEQELPSSACRRPVKFDLHEVEHIDRQVKEELLELIEVKQAGVAYIMGHSRVKTRRTSSILNKFVIDVAYSFL